MEKENHTVEDRTHVAEVIKCHLNKDDLLDGETRVYNGVLGTMSGKKIIWEFVCESIPSTQEELQLTNKDFRTVVVDKKRNFMQRLVYLFKGE